MQRPQRWQYQAYSAGPTDSALPVFYPDSWMPQPEVPVRRKPGAPHTGFAVLFDPVVPPTPDPIDPNEWMPYPQTAVPPRAQPSHTGYSIIFDPIVPAPPVPGVNEWKPMWSTPAAFGVPLRNPAAYDPTPPVPMPVASHEGRLRGRYRIANDAKALYELYIGEDAEPDLAAAADKTSATLPFDSDAISAPGAGTKVVKCVVRRRNAYDLISQNVGAFQFEIDTNGDLVATPPSAPVDVAIAPAASGAMLVTARYLYNRDRSTLRADTWLVYLTSDGTDPDPALDTPTEVTMVLADGIAKLSYTTTTYANGLTIKAIVGTRRSGTPDVDNTTASIVSSTSNTSGSAAVDGDLFTDGEIAQ